jgi:hypothetical protein
VSAQSKLDRLPSTEITLRAIARLRTLVAPEFPKFLSNDAPVTTIVAAALVARAVGTTDAIVEVAGLRRRSDLAALTRNLYEQVVVLAWLLAKPSPERVALWQRYDNEQRIKVHNDMRQAGRSVLTEENWLRSKIQVVSLGDRRMPNLADLAKEADEHWAPRLPGLKPEDGFYSFRGLYRTIYRSGSAFTHATLVGLGPVVERTDAHTVIQLEPQLDARPVLLIVPSILGFALWMTSDVYGWPRTSDISAVFDQVKAEQAAG